MPGSPKSPLKCPVCSATFRDAELCPRCGTDLTILMKIAARAWALRRRARIDLLNADVPAAIQNTAAARKLRS